MLVALPLIPVFMVLIGLAHRGPVRGGARRDDHPAVPAARPRRRHPHAAGARPGRRPAAPDRRTRCRPSPFGDGDAAHRVPVGAGAGTARHPGCRAGRRQRRPAPGVRRDDACGRSDRAAAGTGGVLATAPRRRRVPRRPGRKDGRGEGVPAPRHAAHAACGHAHRGGGGARPIHIGALGADVETWSGDGADRAQRCWQNDTAAGHSRVEPGDVRIDGVDVADLDPRAWWAQVAWLAQRPVLVPGTIRDNLALFGRLPTSTAPAAPRVSTRCWPCCPTDWTR